MSNQLPCRLSLCSDYVIAIPHVLVLEMQRSLTTSLFVLKSLHVKRLMVFARNQSIESRKGSLFLPSISSSPQTHRGAHRLCVHSQPHRAQIGAQVARCSVQVTLLWCHLFLPRLHHTWRCRTCQNNRTRSTAFFRVFHKWWVPPGW